MLPWPRYTLGWVSCFSLPLGTGSFLLPETPAAERPDAPWRTVCAPQSASLCQGPRSPAGGAGERDGACFFLGTRCQACPVCRGPGPPACDHVCGISPGLVLGKQESKSTPMCALGCSGGPLAAIMMPAGSAFYHVWWRRACPRGFHCDRVVTGRAIT
ncbi:hypothetical protein NDU88_001382 [Pleurodeles waltl]|uniref:Uncharacterized protein n=1 Tax=Pleurodeles waltl TaxID=8319 RepID=A0AAV7R8F0_PLEWA|nr:hypothetical protein NDU88_001382 [Pleurodeles waltl]